MTNIVSDSIQFQLTLPTSDRSGARIVTIQCGCCCPHWNRPIIYFPRNEKNVFNFIGKKWYRIRDFTLDNDVLSLTECENMSMSDKEKRAHHKTFLIFQLNSTIRTVFGFGKTTIFHLSSIHRQRCLRFPIRTFHVRTATEKSFRRKLLMATDFSLNGNFQYYFIPLLSSWENEVLFCTIEILLSVFIRFVVLSNEHIASNDLTMKWIPSLSIDGAQTLQRRKNLKWKITKPKMAKESKAKRKIKVLLKIFQQ